MKVNQVVYNGLEWVNFGEIEFDFNNISQYFWQHQDSDYGFSYQVILDNNFTFFTDFEGYTIIASAMIEALLYD